VEESRRELRAWTWSLEEGAGADKLRLGGRRRAGRPEQSTGRLTERIRVK